MSVQRGVEVCRTPRSRRCTRASLKIYSLNIHNTLAEHPRRRDSPTASQHPATLWSIHAFKSREHRSTPALDPCMLTRDAQHSSRATTLPRYQETPAHQTTTNPRPILMLQRRRRIGPRRVAEGARVRGEEEETEAFDSVGETRDLVLKVAARAVRQRRTLPCAPARLQPARGCLQTCCCRLRCIPLQGNTLLRSRQHTRSQHNNNTQHSTAHSLNSTFLLQSPPQHSPPSHEMQDRGRERRREVPGWRCS